MIPFALATFMGAALMFWLEPLVGRLVVPLMGGVPATWNTCMVFFQAALVAGYALAHGLARLSPRARTLAYAALALAAGATLPLGVPPEPPAGAAPVAWLSGTLARLVGLPFLALATGGPLLQLSAAARGLDPYPLYAVSNAGSLLALLAFPLALEPALALATQRAAWSAAFAAFALAAVACIAAPAAVPAKGGGGEPTPTSPVRWFVLAAVPSSLLLGVTAHISLDIAALPLLWVVPLAIYLGTFILAFARRPPDVDAAVPPLVLAVVVSMVCNARSIGWLPVHLAACAALMLVCHAQLAASRPPPAGLTRFYLWIGLGGAAGGLFNAVVAPVVFDRLSEYPIMLAVACFLRPGRKGLDGALAVAVAALWTMRAVVIGPATDEEPWMIAVRVVLLVPLWTFWGAPRTRFALAIAMLCATLWLPEQSGQQTLLRVRTFFGAMRVVRDPATHIRKLVHGGTTHGVQDDSGRPLIYYHEGGPCGDLFAALAPRRVAVVGLGAGSLAAYARPGDTWTFHEIDPEVVRIASDPQYFTFLEACKVKPAIVIGDARLTLRATPPASLDLLVLDAFSSDSIPAHLLSREAVEMYLTKLSGRGAIAFHLSNRYLRLEPLIGALANDMHLAGRVRDDSSLTPEEAKRGRATCEWAVLVRNPAALENLVQYPRWGRLWMRRGVPAWTDDHASVWSVVR